MKIKDFLKRLWRDEAGFIDPATAMMLAQGLGSILGGVFGPDPARRLESNRVNAVNQTDEISRIMQELGLGSFSPGRQSLVNQLDTPLDANQQNVFAQLMGLGGDFQSAIGGIPALFQQAGQYVDPRDLGPQNRQVYDAATQDISNRGNTAQLSAVEDRLNEWRDANRAALGPVMQNASDIIGSGGRTDESQQMAQAMLDIIGSGGQTGETSEMFGAGMDLVNTGGMTPELQQLMGTFQSQLASGGLTPEARRILEPLEAIIQSGGRGGAVLDDQVVTSFARDAAATANAQASEAVRRQAVQRGSAPGVLAGSGLQNQMLAEFGDVAAQNEARALREAVMGQQQARLQNFGIATGGAGDILRNATQLLASANAGLGDVARASSANLATGAGLASDSQRIASQNLGLGISGFNQNFANEIARLGTGGDILGTAGSLFNQSEAGSAQGLLDVERARRDQQNAAVAQMLGLGDQSLAARGQNLGAASSQIDATLRGLLGQGTALEGAGNLASTGRGQQMGAASTLYGGGLDLLSLMSALNGQRVGALTNSMPQQTNLQTFSQGMGSQIFGPRSTFFKDLGGLFGWGGGSSRPDWGELMPHLGVPG